MGHLDAKTNVDAGGIMKTPSDTYTCEDRFKMEWDTFFLNHPQIIGMSGDLPKNDTFVTTQDFGIPILATRNSKGEFKAYANVCSHRGVIVEGERKGEKAKFSCPFHGWTFNNEGSLIGYPKGDHFGEIDKSCYGLKPLPCIEKYGFLWVHPSEDGEINLKDLLGYWFESLESGNLQNIDSPENKLVEIKTNTWSQHVKINRITKSSDHGRTKI